MTRTHRALVILFAAVLLASACNSTRGDSVTGPDTNAPPASSPAEETPEIVTTSPPTPRVLAIAAGDDGSLAVLSDGTVWQWGMNVGGVLGNNGEDLLTPRRIEGLTGVVAVATSGAHSLALTQGGSVWSWGATVTGELDNGEYLADASTPVKLNLPEAVALDACTNDAPDGPFSRHAMALSRDGTVWVWGSNDYGQLGLGQDDSSVPIPTKVPGLTNVTSLACGKFAYSLAVGREGTVWAWGRNTWVLLGTGSTDKIVPVPTPVQGLDDVVRVAASTDQGILALKRDGTVWFWGDSDQPPKQVPGLSDITAVAAGNAHFLALKKDGSVWAWGEHSDGTTLGTRQGYPPTFEVPYPVAGLTNVVAIAAGSYHSLALAKDGAVWAWGRNNRGQLGEGTRENRPTPVRVRFPASN